MHITFDIELLGDCDVVVAELCKRAGWELNHEMVPGEQSVDVQLVETYNSRWSLKVAEEAKSSEGPETSIKTDSTCTKDIQDTIMMETSRTQKVR